MIEMASPFSSLGNYKSFDCQIEQYQSGDTYRVDTAVYFFRNVEKRGWMDELALQFRKPALTRNERKREEKSSRFLCEEACCVSLKGIGEG